ncbi:uncharacterized protein LOC127813308 [Diospyros lotus]|uniref:uncharacterized protein LOC127813308 n=1 Tax=Diospyros lotus TaxID=55363 RepID=UPI00225C42F8|nr:uncharacterized protein LOC127813308 [Diospyros lotus]
MGNCMETCGDSRREGEKGKGEAEGEGEGGFAKESGFESGSGGGVRIKVVLTKEELEWLVFRLKEKGGMTRVEEVLGEIERGRSSSPAAGKAADGWKPSLESIMESPDQLVEMNR